MEHSKDENSYDELEHPESPGQYMKKGSSMIDILSSTEGVKVKPNFKTSQFYDIAESA